MKEKVPSAWASWRFYFVLVVLSFLSVLLVWRVVTLQVVNGIERGYEFLQDQGQARSIRSEKIPAHRGMITDRYGEPIAVSTPVRTIWANPRILLAQGAHWRALSQALEMPYKQLKEKLLRYQNKEFIYLQRHIVPTKAQRVLALDVPGVYSQEEYKRYYPAGEVAAHLVGFTDIDEKGQEGMELAFDNWLRGVAGKKSVLKDLRGRSIKDIKLLSPAVHGKDVALSIDMRIQYLAYRELKAAIVRNRAKAGSLVVLDVQTGEVLAMVNQPSYNPNNRRDLKAEHTRNRAVVDVFEPGSTVKPFTVVAALKSGKYTPRTLVNTNPGYIKVGNKTLLDPVNYGLIDVTKVLVKSSQVGTSKIALTLNPQEVYETFYQVGLGQDTGSGFPGEGVGKLPNYSKWKAIDRAAFAFGHGLSVTTLQLARAYAVLANKGEKRDVSLLKVSQAGENQAVVDAQIADDVVHMLRSVTEEGGTATRARVEAYTVAGKTGTSHKVGKTGYEAGRYRALFAGMAPASQPRVVAVVMVDDPRGEKYYGGEVAAPVFAKVMAGTLRLMNIAPDDVLQQDFAKKSSLVADVGVGEVWH